MKYFAPKKLIEIVGIAMCKLWVCKKIHYDVVIVRIDGIGDYVIWHDCISAYKERFNGDNVLIICEESFHELALEEDLFCSIISFNLNKIKSSPRYAFSFFRKIKSIQSETVINSMRERDWYSDLICIAIASSNRISFSINNPGRPFLNYYNKHYKKQVECINCESEILANQIFTQEIILQDYKYGTYPLIVRRESIINERDYTVISFTSSVLSKNWPIDRFAEIINSIPNNYKIVLTGYGKYDEMLANKLESLLIDKYRVINIVGKTSIVDLVCVISKSSFVIGNDSAAVHIAAACHVPSLAITPGIEFKRFLPYPEEINYKYSPHVVANIMPCYNCKALCIYPCQNPYECIRTVSVETVRSELLSILYECSNEKHIGKI